MHPESRTHLSHTLEATGDIHSEAAISSSFLVYITDLHIWPLQIPRRFTNGYTGDTENRSGNVKWPFEIHCNIFIPQVNRPFE